MTDPEELGLRPVKKKAAKNPLGLRPVNAAPEDIGLRPVGEQQAVSPDISFFEAIGKTIEPTSENAILRGLEYVGNTISIPTRLLYSGIQAAATDETFNQALANKTEAGRLLFGDDAGLLGLGADILLDPMNFVSGAGLVKAGKKVGKLFGAVDEVADAAKIASKVGKAEEATDEAAKAIARLDKNLVGEGKLTKDAYTAQFLEKDQEKIAAFRGPKLDLESKSAIMREMDDNTVSKLYEDVVSNRYKAKDPADKAFIITEHIKRNAKQIVEAGKEGKVDDALATYIAASTGAGKVLRAIGKLNYDVIDALKKHGDADVLKLLKDAGMDIKDPTTLDKLTEWATMIKLTGLSTHVRAIIGNGSMLFFRPFEKAGAAAWDALVHGIKGTPRSVYASEALAEINGARRGIKEGLRKAFETLKSEEKALQEQSKFGEVINRHGAIKGLSLGKLGEKVGVKDFGEFVRSPGRLIGAVDVFFKELNYGAELAAQATRVALKNDLKGADLERFVADAIANPVAVLGRDVMNKVKFSARERVFQEELGPLADAAGKLRTKAPILRLIMPFWNTPINLLKQGVQRTPLTVALPSTWKKIAKGGADASEIIGRAITGSLFIGSAIYGGLSGYITGSGGKKRDLLYTTGWQPHSIKFGDAYISYRGFEPLSSWLRAAGDIAERDMDQSLINRIAKNFTTSYMSQFIENPFLMGVNDIVKSGKELKRGDIPDVLTNMAIGATIPTILQQWATRVYDPVIRQPRGALKKFASRLPVVSKSVVPMRDIFGDIVTREHPIAQALGFQTSFEKDDPIPKELLRLNIRISKPSRRILGEELSDEEYDRLQMLVGMSIRKTIERFINSPAYGQIDDELRAKVIKKKINRIRRMMRDNFQRYYRR